MINNCLPDFPLQIPVTDKKHKLSVLSISLYHVNYDLQGI